MFFTNHSNKINIYFNSENLKVIIEEGYLSNTQILKSYRIKQAKATVIQSNVIQQKATQSHTHTPVQGNTMQYKAA